MYFVLHSTKKCISLCCQCDKTIKIEIMKNSFKNLEERLSSSQIENLTKTPDETIAYGLVKVNRPIFTSADLWNIQKHIKPRLQRRFI